MKSNKKRMVNRMVVILSLLSILGIIVSFIDFRLSIKRVEFKHLQESLKESAKHTLVDMNHVINEMVRDLEQTAAKINEYDDFWDPDIKEILKISNNMNWFHYTAIADAEGNSYDNSGNIFNNAEREYFKTAMQGQVAFSEVIESKAFDGKRVQIIAHPIRSEDKGIRGVVLGVFDIDMFEDIVSYKDRGKGSSLYIIDSCGTYIGKFQENSTIVPRENFWSDLARIRLDKQTVSKIQSDFEGRQEGEFTYTHKGQKYYVAYAPIGPNKWQLVYSVSDSSIDEIVQSLYKLDTKSTMFAMSCYLILILCIIWYFKQSNDKIRKSHQEAKRNIEYMHIAMEHSNNIVFEYNQKNREVRLNTGTRNKLFSSTLMTNVPESFIAMNVIAPDSIHAFEKMFETIKNEYHCEENIHLCSDDKEIWCRISMNNIYDERDAIIGTVGIVEDISEQKKQEAAMKRKLQIQDTLIANALLYAKVDLKTGTLLELNGKEDQISFQEFMHKMVEKSVSEEHIAYVEQRLSLESLKEAYQQEKEASEIEFLVKCGNAYKWVSCVVYRIYGDDESTVILIVTDIDERKRGEIMLKQQAEHDGLTGLYNAAATRKKINEILSINNTLNESHVFALFDLDNYKQINDTFGHSYGDQVLIDTAKILNTRFRSDDIIGRLGGDEFIVLLRNIKSYDYAVYLIEELCKSIHKTYKEGDKEVTLSASVGVAIAPNDGNTFEELYRKSDMAQYEIKKHGKNGVRRYQ